MDTEQLTKILLQVALGAPAPKHESAEAALMRARLTKEVEEISRKGYVLDIPSETPG